MAASWSCTGSARLLIFLAFTVILPVGAKFNKPVLVIVNPVPTILLVLTLLPVTLPAAKISPTTVNPSSIVT